MTICCAEFALTAVTKVFSIGIAHVQTVLAQQWRYLDFKPRIDPRQYVDHGRRCNVVITVAMGSTGRCIDLVDGTANRDDVNTDRQLMLCDRMQGDFNQTVALLALCGLVTRKGSMLAKTVHQKTRSGNPLRFQIA